ncbi:MAG: carbamate kinase [Ignavibacteriae bacterium]|nr:MAG: carbamate kinase [Ignavibacteriota bacterium]
MKKKLAVIALGGNALLKGDEIGTIDEQEKNVLDTCKQLVDLIKMDYNIIITHGNGPQVGNLLLKNEAGYDKYKLPQMPMDICVADSQGEIGYMIERMMRNVLSENNLEKNVITIVTQVLVDKFDPAFENPTKPVGPFYLKEEADLLAKKNDWVFQKDSQNRGWRKVVASPQPVEIMNESVIKSLANEGNIVIAVGGGGIPVFKHENSFLEAIEAVIDKDLASSVLATKIEADVFYIITDVPKVYINFNKPNQKALDNLTVSAVSELFDKGEFGAGSMAPKIKAAIKFADSTGKESVITDAPNLPQDGCGTRIQG